MERQKIEQNIIKKLHEIWDLYKKYNPDGTYLALCISEDESETDFSANNAYWAEDADHTIDAWDRNKEHKEN